MFNKAIPQQHFLRTYAACRVSWVNKYWWLMVGSDAEFGKKSIWSTNSKFVYEVYARTGAWIQYYQPWQHYVCQPSNKTKLNITKLKLTNTQGWCSVSVNVSNKVPKKSREHETPYVNTTKDSGHSEILHFIFCLIYTISPSMFY